MSQENHPKYFIGIFLQEKFLIAFKLYVASYTKMYLLFLYFGTEHYFCLFSVMTICKHKHRTVHSRCHILY